MSFTPNIVNIHRTILHVLALHLEGGKILVYFTRTPQKEGRRGGKGSQREEEEKEECQTPYQGCEVILSLVESSVLVGRPFFKILLSNRGMKISFHLSGGKLNQNHNRSFLSSLFVQHH